VRSILDCSIPLDIWNVASHGSGKGFRRVKFHKLSNLFFSRLNRKFYFQLRHASDFNGFTLEKIGSERDEQPTFSFAIEAVR
jgi:hypothetical protein